MNVKIDVSQEETGIHYLLFPTYSGQTLNFIFKYEYLNIIFEKGLFQGWDYSSACRVLTEDGQEPGSISSTE